MEEYFCDVFVEGLLHAKILVADLKLGFQVFLKCFCPQQFMKKYFGIENYLFIDPFTFSIIYKKNLAGSLRNGASDPLQWEIRSQTCSQTVRGSFGERNHYCASGNNFAN